MDKLLIMGINTRPLVNSSFQLDYETYSGSYFKTADFKVPHSERHILNQEPNKSCGFFEKKYSPFELLDLCCDWISEVDYIVLSTGVSPNDFDLKNNVVSNVNKNLGRVLKKNKKKIIGNKNIHDVEDKFKFYKRIKNKFLVPLTYEVNDIDEAFEIDRQYDDKKFIIKPIQGSGGYGINLLNTKSNFHFNDKNFNSEKNNDILEHVDSFIIQEFISGKNISSSVLSTKKESKSIVLSENNNNNNNNEKNTNYKNNNYENNDKNSINYKNNNIKNDININNILHEKLQNKNFNEKLIDFRYSGNITPLDENKYSYCFDEIKNISEEVISNFNLIGSNGADMIINNDNQVYIIEVNPRFQGTYECIESSLGINMLESHIKACEGELIEIPPFSKCCIKKIIYSENKIKFRKNIIDMLQKDINASNSPKNKYNKTNYNNKYLNSYICDIPYDKVIIEKNQPLMTIISHEKTLNETKIDINNITNKLISQLNYKKPPQNEKL
jgi:predicted ATP-grasp superfamily ATP-dependent carboligase